jgi:tetratricopeptide (TPR) repeat protein
MAADWITRGFAEMGGVEVVQHYSGFADYLREGASAREAALASGAGLFLTGSVRKSGDSLVFEARIDNTSDATVLRVLPPVRLTPSDAGRAVGRLSDLATGALATHLDPRLTQWAASASQPPDLDAYRIFVQGLDQFLVYPMDWDAAQASFLDAFSRDSLFHTALLWGLYASGARGDFPLAESLMRLLEERREVLTAWEEAFFDAQVAGFKGDRERSHRAWREVVRMAPNSAWKHNLAMAAYGLNRYQEAVALFRSNNPPRGWMRDSPFHGYYFTRALHMLEAHDDELAQARVWAARFPTNANAMAGVPIALVALGRIDEAIACVDSIGAVSQPRQIRIALPSVAAAMTAHGYDEEARTLFRMIATSIEASGDTSVPARFTYARSLFRSGQAPEARRVLMEIVEGTPGHAGAIGELAIVRLALGDTAASDWLARLEQSRNHYQRARVLSELGQRDSAAALLWRFRGPEPFTLHHTPEFRSLQSQARFRELLRPRD